MIAEAVMQDWRTICSRLLESPVELGQGYTVHARSIWMTRSSGISEDKALEGVLVKDENELAVPLGVVVGVYIEDGGDEGANVLHANNLGV